jgi:hypothetical protein
MDEKRQRGFGVTASWLIVWVIIGVFAFHGMRDLMSAREQQLRVSLRKHLEIAQAENRNSMTLLEQDLKRKARESEARRTSELETAWGGPLAAAFKNPAYSIREALQHAAEACTPANTYAHAEVDRFTEFTVTIDSPETISTNQMIAVARKFIPAAKDYLSALRFSRRGNLVAELDHEDIGFIDDWTRAPDSRIAMLLPRESRTRVAQDPAAIERYQNEQRISEALANDPAMRDKTDAANRDFRQSLQNAYGELTLAFEGLQKSVALGGVRSLHDLDNRDKELRNAVEHIDRARKFWTDPAKEWQRSLEAEAVLADLRDLLVKGFPAIFRVDPARTAKVFEALSAQVESCRFVLRLLEDETDQWKFSGGGIAITDEEFGRKLDRAQRQVREDFQATETALRSWHDAVGP